MNTCRITLKKIKNGVYAPAAGKSMWETSKGPEALRFSRSEFFTEGPKYVNGMSISGVQQKLSLILKNGNLEFTTTDGRYILKPSPESYPFAAENEHCAMAISRLLGIDTAQAAIVPFSDGEFSYVTKRYDRIGKTKLHQEDLLSASNQPSKEKYSGSYEEALKLAYLMSGKKLKTVRDLFIRIVYAFVIGNDDLHMKNMGLIRDVNNRSPYYDRLTPAYDQLFTFAFENHSKIGVLALYLLSEEGDGVFSETYEKFGSYTGFDFVTLGKRVGLTERIIKTSLSLFITKATVITDGIERSFMPLTMQERALQTVQERIELLKLM